MKHSFSWSVLLASVLVLTCVSNGSSEQLDRPGWKLVFHDEFDETALDLDKWNPMDPSGRERNHELQAYVTNAFEVKDGILRIRAEKREAFYGGKQRSFTSGMMTTHHKFSQQYGRFEIRCRVPKGKGMWPAFWLLPERRAGLLKST